MKRKTHLLLPLQSLDVSKLIRGMKSLKISLNINMFTQKKYKPFPQSIKKILKLSNNKRMRFLIPEIFWTGISIAYYSGMLVEMMSASIADRNTNSNMSGAALESYEF